MFHAPSQSLKIIIDKILNIRMQIPGLVDELHGDDVRQKLMNAQLETEVNDFNIEVMQTIAPTLDMNAI